MIDTRFDTSIDLRGEIENYRQVALIKYYKILLELDPRRDRLTMLAVLRCIDKLERHSQERKRPRCDRKPMELSLGTIRNATNSFGKPGYTTSSPHSTSSITKRYSTHPRNGRNANNSKPAGAKRSGNKRKEKTRRTKKPPRKPHQPPKTEKKKNPIHTKENPETPPNH